MPSQSRRRVIRFSAALAIALVFGPAKPEALLSQVAPPVRALSDAAPRLEVTDARLAAALDRLVAGSPTARRVLQALASSGLPVTIGTPRQLAAVPDSEGGPVLEERKALLADPDGRTPGSEPPIAWVVFRVAPPRLGSPPGFEGTVERAWVAIRADSVERWIGESGAPNAPEHIRDDFLAILAHEFVAHVGSVALTKRIGDFCDDPPPSADETPRSAGDLACSIRVENQVRRELNAGLGLEGSHRLPQRRSYALDVMYFAKAYLKTR